MKCNQSRPGFELMSPCPFPTMITITLRAPPKSRGHQLWACLSFFSNAAHVLFVLLGWFVRWKGIGCFVRCCFQDWFKTAFSCSFHLVFFSMHFVCMQEMHPYSGIDIATAWKKSDFISLERSDFYMMDNLSVAVHAFARHMLLSLSVDEILLLR